MKNLLSVSEAISAKILFIIEENGRDAEYTRACAMWNMDIEIEHIPFRGFQRAVTEQYDVVVIDDYLAGKSGYTLAMEIMDRCDVIMIMLGKDMDDVSVVGAFRMGIMDYLPAGTSPTQLAARSVALVNRYRESNASTSTRLIPRSSLFSDPLTRIILSSLSAAQSQYFSQYALLIS